MTKLFQRIIWHNNTTPAINESNLNAISKGLDDIDDRVIELADKIFEVLPIILQTLQEVQETLQECQELETKLQNLYYRSIRTIDTWTTPPVTGAVGATSVTIRHEAIFNESYCEVWTYTASGLKGTVTKVVVTPGQAVVHFAKPLKEATGVQLKIKNVRVP